MGSGSGAKAKKVIAVTSLKPKPLTNNLKVFCSHQHTELALKKRTVWHGPNAVIRASMPPFNKLKDVPIQDDIVQFSVPVFGPNILNAIMEIFVGPATCSQMQDLAMKLGVSIPPYAL